MKDALRLYFRYAGISIRAQMQYRASFILQSFGQFFLVIIEFLGVCVLFQRFHDVAGWSLPEVALLYGLGNVAWAVTDLLSYGFDGFGNTVKSGDFDRVLLRPRSTVLQLAGQEISLRRAGRILQGLVVMAWGLWMLDVDWTVGKALVIPLAVLGGAAMFYGLLIVQATLCFWTTEGLEVMNALTYGGMQAARYPFTIYGRWFQRLFTFGVPIAAMSYFPAVAVLEKAEPLGFPGWFGYVSPSLGFVFLGAALQAWRVGIRRYCSTGS